MKKVSFIVMIILSTYALSAQSVFWVASDGDNTSGEGSEGSPWGDITYALDQISDKDTIKVKPGTYFGRIRLRGSFENGVVVKAEVPYESKLRNNGTVVTCYYGQGITLEGFDIAHDGPGAGALVIQIQDLRGDVGDDDYTSRIVIRNNILHDSYNNDILKINNGAKEILVEGNIFYNQEGSDEHIDINSIEDVIVQDNIFMNDFAGSGRTNDNSTSSYIVIKDSNENYDLILGAKNVFVQRNVFMNWEGNTGQGFVRMGEDGMSYHEAQNIVVQNNLMLGNSSNQMRSPFQIMNSKNIVIRHNTIHGDMPAKEFGSRMYVYGSNAPNNENVTITANIWSDPTGTMSDVYNRGASTTNLEFYRNLHWNGGNAFPTSNESIIEVSDDENGLIGDPLLPDNSNITLPRYEEGSKQFADGSNTIAAAFRKIVMQYGTPGESSPAIDNADASIDLMEDILGNPRSSNRADIGAVEVQTGTNIERTIQESIVYYDPQNKVIRSLSSQIGKISVFDCQGRHIGTSEGSFDLNGHKSGMYIAKGIDSEGRFFIYRCIHIEY